MVMIADPDVAPAPPRGVALAEVVLLQLLREPYRHNQESFVDHRDRYMLDAWEDAVISGRAPKMSVDELIASCDIRLCAAGWTVVLGAADVGAAVTACVRGVEQSWVGLAVEMLEVHVPADYAELVLIFDDEMNDTQAIRRLAALFDLNLPELRARVARERRRARELAAVAESDAVTHGARELLGGSS